MTTQDSIDYHRIAEAITYLTKNFKQQPELADVANHSHVSPFHFQRLFTQWAGVSPKKFLQFISVEHAKRMLKNNQTSLFDAAYETGLSGTGRLHDLFLSIEGMTPGEFKNGGENLAINYSFLQSPFGNLIIATTTKGICYMAFADDEAVAFSELQQYFSRAKFRQETDEMQQKVANYFTQDWMQLNAIKLHVKGTPFQLKIWEALLKIPMGKLASYSTIAAAANVPNAARAVGTAVAGNPVAVLIPCHRIIQSTGVIGQYHWGSIRKTAMIGWEASMIFK